ncbi:hypothetical protein PIB30_017205 [Stylosanthes scabra]|uniref:Uncharacterized protein n=1 Tax=Stylosanthes scabra TaxID=79078 RepID=A0ABU6Y880_9FABA|nr:hypothetical protein [Stylosanthes scabra]
MKRIAMAFTMVRLDGELHEGDNGVAAELRHGDARGGDDEGLDGGEGIPSSLLSPRRLYVEGGSDKIESAGVWRYTAAGLMSNSSEWIEGSEYVMEGGKRRRKGDRKGGKTQLGKKGFTHYRLV